MPPEERILRLENAFSTLAELARKQSERTDKSERRIELLIELASTQNARMNEYERRTEELAQAQKEVAGALKELAEAQKQTEAHLSVLNSIVEELGRAQAEAVKALVRVENSLASLNERFEQYISTRP